MKKIIGFATEFYTLWEYSEEKIYTQDSYGNHWVKEVVDHYNYLQNISTSLEKVKSLYPDLSIDVCLRGKTQSWSSQRSQPLPSHIFWFGKYYGKLIDEILVSDFKYCLWALEINQTIAEYIKKTPIYLEYLAEQERLLEELVSNSSTLKEGDKVVVDFLYNGYNADEDYTECWTKALYKDIELKVLCGVKFVDCLYPYLMPIINGKAQRTKGKSIEIHVREIIETVVESGKVVQYIKTY